MKNKIVFPVLALFAIVGLAFLGAGCVNCSESSDCPGGQKCEENLCIAVGCIEAGQAIPNEWNSSSGKVDTSHLATELCQGLVNIPEKRQFDDRCNTKSCLGCDYHDIASDCGNGACEEWESKCNCPADCE